MSDRSRFIKNVQTPTTTTQNASRTPADPIVNMANVILTIASKEHGIEHGIEHCFQHCEGSGRCAKCMLMKSEPKDCDVRNDGATCKHAKLL